MKTPIRLILARHGNTFESGQTPTQVGAKTDLPLTTEGKEQAKRLAHYLVSKGIKPSGIYAGNLKRQVESAKAVAEHFSARTQYGEEGLTEIDFGAWEGLSSKEISSKWPSEYSDWSHEGKWAENVFQGSMQEHVSKIENWLKRLRKTHAPGDTVLGITSNGVIRFFYALQKSEWEHLRMNRQMETIKVKTGHFCEIELFEDTLKVISWNQEPK